MLESDSLFSSPLSPPKDYTVKIPDVDPTQPLFLGLSIFAKYHKGDYFKALISYLYDLYIDNRHKNGRIIMALGGGDLLKRNFMAQWGVEDEKDQTIQTLIAREEKNWETANLNMDPEVQIKVEALKAKGKLEFYHWNAAKKAFEVPLKESATELDRQLAGDSEYREKVMDSANASLLTKRAQPAFANAILINESFVRDQCIEYTHEEGKVFAAWGVGREEDKIEEEEYSPQMAYPVSFGTESDKPNIPFFDTITAAVKGLSNNRSTLRLLDITFTVTPKFALTTRGERKGSLDSRLTEKQQEQQQEKRHVSELKQKIRRLQEEIQQLTRQVNQVIALFIKHNPGAELPATVSRVIARRKPSSHPNDELDINTFTLATQEFEREMLAIDLTEVTLTAKRLGYEVEQLQTQNQQLRDILQKLENETIPLQKGEIGSLEAKVVQLKHALAQSRATITSQALLINVQLEKILKKNATIASLKALTCQIMSKFLQEVAILYNTLARQHETNEELRNEIHLLRNMLSVETEERERAQAEICGLRADLKEARETLGEKTAELTLAHEGLADLADKYRLTEQEARIALEAFTDSVDAAKANSLSRTATPPLQRNPSVKGLLTNSHANLLMLGPPKRQAYSVPTNLHLGKPEKDESFAVTASQDMRQQKLV